MKEKKNMLRSRPGIHMPAVLNERCTGKVASDRQTDLMHDRLIDLDGWTNQSLDKQAHRRGG